MRTSKLVWPTAGAPTITIRDWSQTDWEIGKAGGREAETREGHGLRQPATEKRGIEVENSALLPGLLARRLGHETGKWGGLIGIPEALAWRLFLSAED